MKSVTVFAPATVANVACGFDIFGFAVNEPGDVAKVTLRENPGVEITRITGDNGKLPKAAEKNTAGFAALRYLETIQSQQGVSIELHKKMPLSSGLGSSAASAVAVLFAINTLFDNRLTKSELLSIALQSEKLACGAAHADNAAPALFGGFLLIRENNPPDIVELPVPENLYCTIIHPEIEINTADARNILAPNVPLKDAVKQWANTAGLVAGLYRKDLTLISRSMNDYIIEPQRAKLIPHFYEMKKAALDRGALGCSISGSGPSLFALSNSQEIAQKIAGSMSAVLANYKICNQIYISTINTEGPKIIAQEG
ncbi:MAG TPA: homoserine kinase [Candidatus Marinimicrobia bacterium]|nr:homoserine kinase [Candidatus Neomarinimicrobiota bacterium]HQQ85557.1 homoserine kinase [Candidatus Neomarinimicrobiota bacterium]